MSINHQDVQYFKKVLRTQKTFIYSPYKFTAFVGGYGSGKTEALLLKLIIQKIEACENGLKNHVSALYTLDFPLMSTTLVPRLLELIERMGISCKHDKQIGKIFLGDKYGSIILRTYTHPERIVGYEVHDSYLDELDVLPTDKAAAIWQRVIARNRKKGKDNTASVATTPEGLRFVYDIFDGGNRVEKQLKGYKYYQAKTTDNIYIPSDYVESLKATYDEKRVQAYINGEFVNLNSGLVYYNYNHNSHGSIDNIETNTVLHIGQDFNIGGCVSIVIVEKDDKIHVIDEIVSHDTQSICINIENKYGKTTNLSNIIFYPDASGKNRSSNAASTDIRILQNYGYSTYFSKRNPYIRDRINIVNFLLGKDILKIDQKKCPRLHDALSRQGYDSKGEPEKFAGSATIDDFVDALGYCLYYKYGYKLNERLT